MIPLHPEYTFLESRAISEAGLRHTAQLGTTVVVRWPNGEETQTVEFADPIPCRMSVTGSRTAEIAAAQGVKAQWTVVFKQSVDVTVGQKVIVKGTTDGTEWERLVEVTSDLGLAGRIHRLATAVDTDLNQ